MQYSQQEMRPSNEDRHIIKKSGLSIISPFILILLAASFAYSIDKMGSYLSGGKLGELELSLHMLQAGLLFCAAACYLLTSHLRWKDVAEQQFIDYFDLHEEDKIWLDSFPPYKDYDIHNILIDKVNLFIKGRSNQAQRSNLLALSLICQEENHVNPHLQKILSQKDGNGKTAYDLLLDFRNSLHSFSRDETTPFLNDLIDSIKPKPVVEAVVETVPVAEAPLGCGEEGEVAAATLPEVPAACAAVFAAAHDRRSAQGGSSSSSSSSSFSSAYTSSDDEAEAEAASHPGS